MKRTLLAALVVTAGRNGAVAALRVQRAASFRPGAKLRAKASKLGDGTYRVRRVKRRGRAGAARPRWPGSGRSPS